jgi:uncharacterized oxidoreductase
MKLKNRTVLITGGTSGIGLELARQLLDRGNTVIVTGRDHDRLAAAGKALPAAHLFRSDVADPAAMEALQRDVLTRFPALDTLVNNAGIMRNLKLAAPRDLQDVSREIEIGLMGPVRMVQQFLPCLTRQPSALIVNVSSGLAFIPFPISPIYSAAKAGLHAYTQCLRAQLAGSSVRIVELAPPGTETPLFRGEFSAEMKGHKAMDPEILVSKAIAAIEAGKTEIRPGLSNMLKIASRVAPSFVFGQMAKIGQPNRQAT